MNARDADLGRGGASQRTAFVRSMTFLLLATSFFAAADLSRKAPMPQIALLILGMLPATLTALPIGSAVTIAHRSGACAVQWKENRPTDPLRHACRSNWSPHLNPEIIGMANGWIKEDAINAKDSGRI
ncbi:hypothetical protein [Streptomyces bacillaris]|uniref:hypothetical protein n=1 Tax=Streptomyces bacillaris TaxID=68179 RepID=UPI0036FEEE1A